LKANTLHVVKNIQKKRGVKKKKPCMVVQEMAKGWDFNGLKGRCRKGPNLGKRKGSLDNVGQ